MAMLASINGICRDLLYGPVIGDLHARMMSTLILITVIIAVLFVYVIKTQPTEKETLCIGVLMTAMTALFDLSLGLIEGKSVSWLLNDYNVLQGKLFPLVLLTTLIAPYFIRRSTYAKNIRDSNKLHGRPGSEAGH